jgi:hypothetical protein
MIAAATTLNVDQLKAVEHPGGSLLVLAGPGTRKTGVLVERISHLVRYSGQYVLLAAVALGRAKVTKEGSSYV